LGHDELNVLVLNALSVNLFLIVLLFLGCGLLAVAVVVAGVVVVVSSVGKLLGSGGLGAGVEVLNLGLAEDAGKLSIFCILRQVQHVWSV